MLSLLLTLCVGQVRTTGYLDSRTTVATTRADGAAALTELAEGNIQLKLQPLEALTVQADASLYWQTAGFIHGGDRDLPQLRPQAVVSELYLDAQPQEHLRLVVGKKRIVWGSGLAFNPTDVLNPPKDPTDPTFQRAGAWLAQVEFPFERVALSVVGAGKVLRQFAGLPTALILYPDHPSAEAVRGLVPDDRDGEAHWAFSARLYLLLADTDINVTYAYTNLYNDAFRNASRAGLSLSHAFGGLELHAEALAYQGSSRLEADPDCVEQPAACLAAGRPVVSQPHLEAGFFNARALVGGRYQFESEAMASLEYYFNGEGHAPEDFSRLARLVWNAPQLYAAAAGASGDPGTPQKFSFEPLRRHYAVASFTQPRLFDDFTLGATLLVGLEDLSGQLVPQVGWVPKEWLQLTLAAYLPFNGVKAWGADVGGAQYGEFALSPYGPRVLAQARIFY